MSGHQSLIPNRLRKKDTRKEALEVYIEGINSFKLIFIQASHKRIRGLGSNGMSYSG